MKDMSVASRQILRTYLTLTLLSTFAASFIWGINTLFLLDAGLSISQMRVVLDASLDHGLRNPPVRWMMLGAPFGAGVGIYAFYAMQPYLLQLYGRGESYAIAGLAAAIVAGAQIAGGFLVPLVRKVFRLRTSLLITAAVASALALVSIGLTTNFWAALGLLVGWAIIFAASMPIRQAYLNELIPSAQRATVLSSDNLLSSSGGVIVQPALGRVADAWSFSTSYVVGAGIELLALPFLTLARRQRASSDPIRDEDVSGSAASESVE
jgi:MFS family permease